MATIIRVNSQELRRKAEQLEQMNRQFKVAVDRLVSGEQNLATMWEGEAQAAFRMMFYQDQQQFENFYQGIRMYVQALISAAEQYEIAESQNVSIAATRI